MSDDAWIIEGLVKAFDRDDFNAAARFLSDSCVYDSPEAPVIGRDAIINAYRTEAACNGTTGYCGCGPGFISACAPRCCRCAPC